MSFIDDIQSLLLKERNNSLFLDPYVHIPIKVSVNYLEKMHGISWDILEKDLIRAINNSKLLNM